MVIEMKKVYYINHLSDRDNGRNNSLAGDNKIDYIIETLKTCNYELEVISFCNLRDKTHLFKKHPGYTTVYNGIKITYFSSYGSKFKILRGIGLFLTWIEQKQFINKYCLNSDCDIIIYHSLSLQKLYRYLTKKRKDYILEVEEIYSDVLEDKKKRKKELFYLRNASKYIAITELLNNEINKNNKPYIISHGVYKIERQHSKLNFDSNMIHCVYAGTFDPRKGGVDTAVAVAKYLPRGYHVHIIGYDSLELKQMVQGKINNIKKETSARITYDGVFVGNEYTQFLQNCQIGLSTQNPSASFNGTSFPSKILSYMSNGLRVVSVRIPAIETSKVGKYIYYYDKNDPKEIAKVIMSINMGDTYDSKTIIKKLDDDFKCDLESLLGGKK